jgi:hypothetical protein
MPGARRDMIVASSDTATATIAVCERITEPA